MHFRADIIVLIESLKNVPINVDVVVFTSNGYIIDTLTQEELEIEGTF